MMLKPEASSPHSGRKRWWREILQTSWAKGKGTTDATSPLQQTATGQPCELGTQSRKFKVQEWLRWRWKNTGTQLRSKMRWGSLSYIANTWDEELTSSGCSASSATSDPKLDRDGRPVRECPVDDGGNNKGSAEEGIVLDRERLVQALLVGATVAATLYVVYRIGLRYRWWRWRDLEERDSGGVDSVETIDDRKGNDRAPEDSGVEEDPNSSPIDVDERREDNESGTDDGDTASTVAPELSPGRGNSLSDADSLLAEAEDLISSESPKPLSPRSVTEMPSEYREVSGEEVDALVKLTRRAIARDPDALNEIARQAAAHGVVGVSNSAGSSVEGSPVVWRRGRSYVERNGGGLVSGGRGVVGASSSESRRPVHFFA